LTLSDETEFVRLYSTPSIECCELFLAQGSYQRDCLVQAHPSIAGRIVVTGNPRTDVLRPEFTNELRDEARRLQEHFGQFLLVYEPGETATIPTLGELMTGGSA
jgi:hypothetical protein